MKNVEFFIHLIQHLTSSFLPKRCLFIFCIFYLNEKELNQQVCLLKYVENEISNSREEQKESNFKSISKTPEKFLELKLVTNYDKSSLLPLRGQTLMKI